MPSVVRFDPFRDITSLRDEMNRLFTRTLGDSGSGVASWTPAVDVFDTADAIVLRAEVPGLTTDDFDIEVDGDVLTLSGERTFEESVEEGRYHRIERSYGRFARSVTLPQNVKADEISAHLGDGVLTVRVPKADEVRPRRIAVTAGETA
jgi:HSP20 family protein